MTREPGDAPDGQHEKIDDDVVKKNKDLLEPHTGGKIGGSKQDFYKHDDGMIYVHPKGGGGPGEPTGISFEDLDF